MVIGSISKFAIEFEIKSSELCLGNIRLWINNKSLGYFEDEVSLSAVYDQLNYKVNSEDLYFPELAALEKETIYKILIQDRNDKFDNSILSLGESFDDFLIRVFKEDTFLCFISELNRDYDFEYECPDFEINYNKIEINHIKNVLEEFKSFTNFNQV